MEMKPLTIHHVLTATSSAKPYMVVQGLVYEVS